MHGGIRNPLFYIVEPCLINSKNYIYFGQSIPTVDSSGVGNAPVPQIRDESKTATYHQLFKPH